MQSADVDNPDVGCSNNDLNGENGGGDGGVEPRTLIELSNDIVVRESGDSVKESEGGVAGEGLDRGGVGEGESLEGEEGNEDMEVDFVENVGGLRAVNEGLKNLEGSDSRADLGQSECSNQGILGEACFDASEKVGNEETVCNVGVDGASTVIGDVVEVNEPSSVADDEAVEGVKDAVVSEIVNVRDKDEREIQGVGSSKVDDLDSSVVKRVKKSKKKSGFCTSDLVWGKVRSHPWWPAQIFEPDDASEQAKKHFRSKCYLVAYFGDQTFAWNEEAKLKPFAPHFTQMAKQSTAEAFRHAVDCALDEAARRAEFGLSCHCIADDVFHQLEVQAVENAGIREKSHIRKGGDRLYNSSSFEPVKFLDYVNNLAQVPHVEDSVRLEHVVAHAQMSAFYRWKGCYHLAEFGTLKGYVNNEADAPIYSKKEQMNEIIMDETEDPQDKMEEDDIRPQKRKKSLGISGNSTKKPKQLSAPSCKKGNKGVRQINDSEVTDGKDRKLSSSSFGGRKEAKLPSDESKSKESSPQVTPSRESKPGLRVGESIMRAALQLSQPSPLLKLDVSAHKKNTKSNGKSKQHRREIEADPFKKSSLDAILSKFLLAAVDPLKEHSFLSSMITFFSDFRDSIVPSKERPSGSGLEEMAEGCSSGSKSEESGHDGEITTSTGFKSAEDACVPEVQTSVSDEEMVPIEPKPAKADGTSSASLQIDNSVSGSQQHSVSENVASESGPSDRDIVQDESPTALTLKFTDMDSIPTEAKLIKIFSAFGQLKESETEVLPKKNCARVVFKRRSDAEIAFSSSGKFETFGASLVCYRLNYSPSPRKSPSPEAKRRRKDGTVVEGIAA